MERDREEEAEGGESRAERSMQQVAAVMMNVQTLRGNTLRQLAQK